MSPRVTYWTGTWDSEKEAISKEIASLRQDRAGLSPVVGFSPANFTGLRLSESAITLSAQRWLLLRGLAAVIEPLGDVTHVFGGMGSWHLLNCLGRRPLILTVVVPGRGGDAKLPLKPTKVVVETEDSSREWIAAGIAPGDIELVRPGIDLTLFRPTPPISSDRFVLLFASTPSDVAEFEPRGLPLLVELARRCHDVDVLVPWRQWGDVTLARRALAHLDPPSNFVVVHDPAADMPLYFARSHATVLCFAAGAGKACPNFVIEGLASGRPCLATRGTGIASLLEGTGAGLVVNREIEALVRGVALLREQWPHHSERAREVAESEFGLTRFRRAYDRLYRDLATRPSARSDAQTRVEG